MEIAFVSNFRDTCGIATYGENLVRYSDREVNHNIIPISSSINFARMVAERSDLIHINYYYGLQAGFTIEELISFDKPVIVTNHATNSYEPWFKKCKYVIVHEEPLRREANHIVIPHGIPEKDIEWVRNEKLVLSQAGFPFPWKNYYKICMAASRIKELGDSPEVLLFMPETYRSPNRFEIDKCMQNLSPGIPISIETNWIEEDDLIVRLHNEASVMVWYTDGSNGGFNSEGPSGSVRMAISSKRPVVVNGNASQYAGIIGEGGIYPVYRDEDLADTILEAYNDGLNGIYAKNLIAKQSYFQVVKQYKRIYELCLSASQAETATLEAF